MCITRKFRRDFHADNSIFFFFQIQFSVSEITCVVCCSEPSNPRIAVHTPKLIRSKVIRLQFASDTDMEDWLAHLTSGKDVSFCKAKQV